MDFMPVVVYGDITVLTERNPSFPDSKVLALTDMLEGKTEILPQHLTDIPPVQGFDHIEYLHLPVVDNEIESLHPEFIDNGSCRLSVR